MEMPHNAFNTLDSFNVGDGSLRYFLPDKPLKEAESHLDGHGAQTDLRQKLFVVETMAEAERVFSEYLDKEMVGA